ncbi:uncharacterized protein LOC133177870 [Saccostrea echinata]|uniref:uncharacterized protein LOC133177870 n=1 Tax=Saccostrea echinata TaxID=191078 RepID=UPI002A7EDB69|nr:uncharacterized protein LOC133177870 [Saccostrea echinata]
MSGTQKRHCFHQDEAPEIPSKAPCLGQNEVNETVLIDTNDATSDVIQYVMTETSDHYRNGRPYKILFYPGKSTAIIQINLPGDQLVRDMVLTLNHCRTNCHGVIDIFLNDSVLVKGYSDARWDNFGEQTFNVPVYLLKKGTNELTIRLNKTSRGVYWLSDIKIETRIVR